MLAHRGLLRPGILAAHVRQPGLNTATDIHAPLKVLQRQPVDCWPSHGRSFVCAANGPSSPASNGNGTGQEPAAVAPADLEQIIAGSNGSVQPSAPISFLDKNLARKYGLQESIMQSVMELPGSQALSMEQMVQRVKAVGEYRAMLQRGHLPDSSSVPWPPEPLASTLAATLSDLEMPRFCRRFPGLLNTLMQQVLTLVKQFEEELQDEVEEDTSADAQESEEQNDTEPQQNGAPQQSQQQGQPCDEQAEGSDPGGDGGGGDDQSGAEQQVSLDSSSQQQQGQPGQQDQQQQQQEEQRQQAMQARLQAKADELMEGFKQEWEPVAENLDRATKAFDDLSDLMGSKGFDLSQGLWQNSGWQEVDDLRKKLEALKELRELVRSLGRSGGRGPLRRAPEEIEASKKTLGVIRSPLQPEETRGLTRSGDLSRMLPFEAHLMAAGSKHRRAAIAAARRVADGSSTEDEEADGMLPITRAQQAARRLHLVRRAERTLMSYERTGWLEDEPSKLTGRFEIRPAAEQGPIIVCLDTSGSMSGARETVAKAVTLECMRSAHRHGRKCFLYAFSGPRQVQELELAVDAASMARLLDFLTHSFNGGTDVDRPLELSLERLRSHAWSQSDILMVTDGEICPPSEELLDSLRVAQEEMGLEVHGLIVGSEEASTPMKDLCSHLHVFKSWSAVGGTDNYW